MQQNREQNRTIFDWVVFAIIHFVLIGAISVAGVFVYGWRLGLWVAASAVIAGCASMFVFAREPDGATLMKCALGLTVAANAGYLVHNGARAIGVEAYNAGQIEKYERGMAEAGKATSRRIARELRLGAESASKLERAFGDSVALIAALLAFGELASALVIFSIASRRSAPTSASPAAASPPANRGERGEEFPEAIDVKPTGPLPRPDEGKVFRR